jgi:hypothetical protein
MDGFFLPAMEEVDNPEKQGKKNGQNKMAKQHKL